MVTCNHYRSGLSGLKCVLQPHYHSHPHVFKPPPPPPSFPLSLNADTKNHAAATQSTITVLIQHENKGSFENWWRGMDSVLIISSLRFVITWLIGFFCVHTQYCRAVRCMTQDAHDWPWQYRTCFRRHIMKNAIQCQLPAQRARKANISMSQTLVNTDIICQEYFD